VDVLRGLRARGFAGAAVLVVNRSTPPATVDDVSATRLGARRCSLDGDTLGPLAEAVTEALLVVAGGEQATGATPVAVKALRQTQRLLAAGELAMRLQHSLNNPLAALLAEAQLLELETLEQDHRESVERIIELCRRVIDVVRALDGVGRA
jgi:nitrogen-specific signal transduction histidine kinase